VSGKDTHTCEQRDFLLNSQLREKRVDIEFATDQTSSGIAEIMSLLESVQPAIAPDRLRKVLVLRKAVPDLAGFHPEDVGGDCHLGLVQDDP
jgi:hypothetical protein